VTNRYVAVLVPDPTRADPDSADPDSMGAAPPGVDPGEFRLALLEDTYEVVAGLDLVTPALVLNGRTWPAAEAVTWPGTPIIRATTLSAAFAQLSELGAEQAAIVAPDAPDLPPLLIGKLFRALGTGGGDERRTAGRNERRPVQAAVCPAKDGVAGSGGPAHDGGLVALAVWLPAPRWLLDCATEVGLDAPDAFARLRAAAPRPGAVQAGPGWHRLRGPADLAFLDPGLEGWENTRALLAGHPLR
jgi:hypothetical protein